MKNQLQNYFPMIRTQEEILEEIREKAGALVTVPGLERILSAGIPGDL